jgi:putative redox protein
LKNSTTPPARRPILSPDTPATTDRAETTIIAVMHLSLDWHGDMTFENSHGSPRIVLHSSTPDVSSPPQALAYAVMACMGMDVVHVIQKGRHPLRAMTIRFDGERAADPPRRFVTMRIEFAITGDVPAHVVQRAINLSRTKYCSVWNTLRPDLPLETSFTLTVIESGDAPDSAPGGAEAAG